MKIITVFFYLMCFFWVKTQCQPDVVYMSSIKTVKLFQQNNQESLPIIRLGSDDIVELHFDDLDGYAKNFYYCFLLCNADWQPADVSSFDYIQGYQQQRLTQYRNSSIAQTKYVHYQALLPEKNCIPTRSGNYLLKVFLNGDTSQLAFTKRFYVVENKAVVAARITQTFAQDKFLTHQKIQFKITLPQENLFNVQQQLKVIVTQNNRFDNMIKNVQPSFIRENVLEYDSEESFVFEGGNEYRWADLRSFRFLSERVQKIVQPNEIYLKPEGNRLQQRYLYIKDINGFYDISTTDNVNPWSQTEYGKVHFTYVPPNNQPYAGKDVFILGELTGNSINNAGKMEYNASLGLYEKELYLKQGYYNYLYVTKDANNQASSTANNLTEGNYWDTENDYTIFVYYRSLSARHDALFAVATYNSKNWKY